MFLKSFPLVFIVLLGLIWFEVNGNNTTELESNTTMYPTTTPQPQSSSATTTPQPQSATTTTHPINMPQPQSSSTTMFPADTPQPQKVPFSRMCDIVIVFDDSLKMKNEDFENKFVDFVEQIPDIVPIGADRVRVAAIVFGENASVALDLTDDEYKIRKFQADRHPGEPRPSLGLKAAREQFAKHGRTGAMKMVVLISDGYMNDDDDDDYKKTKEEAKQLRKAGVVIYYAFVRRDPDRPADKHDARQITGFQESQVIEIMTYSELTADVFRKVMNDFNCKFEAICHYDNETDTCNATWWSPGLDVGVDCDKQKPMRPYRIRCQKEKCAAVCNQTWKWACVFGYREKKMIVSQVKPIYDHCPPAKEVRCPGVTTTAAPAPTTENPALRTVFVVLIVFIVLAFLFLIACAGGVLYLEHKEHEEEPILPIKNVPADHAPPKDDREIEPTTPPGKSTKVESPKAASADESIGVSFKTEKTPSSDAKKRPDAPKTAGAQNPVSSGKIAGSGKSK